MPRMTGKKALLEMLRAEGVEYIFGNPGTSEGAIMDALEDYPDLHYVLATQEGAAMGAADSAVSSFQARVRKPARSISARISSGVHKKLVSALRAHISG